jgi:branched-chain amino acid transport system permease protein
MSSALITNTVINISLLVILCIGFTFTYMMDKFPNFAHTSYASIGTMVAFYLVKFMNFNPYFTWPVATLFGGVIGVFLYLGIVKQLKKQGAKEITLTFMFYILSVIIASGLAMFSFWLLIGTHTLSSGFLLRNFDITVEGVPLIGYIAPAMALLLVIILNLFFRYSKFGIAMRATAEDEKLSSSLGVNVNHVHLVSWFISGGLAALAGAIIPMWMGTSVNFSDTLLVSVMAGSVLGGLENINGAIIGGIIVASSQKLFAYSLMRVLGVWVGGYEGMIPIVILFTILAIEPNGLTAIKRENISVTNIRQALIRLKKSLLKLIEAD